MSNAPYQAPKVPGTRAADTNRSDLPQESTDALISSMRNVILAETGLEILVEREVLPASREGEKDLSLFVVTLPQDATPAQRAEADHWLNEIAPLFRYAQQTIS